jgi:hypothetical protein
MFFTLVARHLEQLSDFVRHQIAYLEAIGDLTTGELTPDDVIDEVLLRAYRELDGNVDEHTLHRRLTALVRETLEAAVNSARVAPPHARAPLKLEDLVPDLETPTPEDEAARGVSTPEMHRVLDRARHYVRQRLVESGCRFRRPAAA